MASFKEELLFKLTLMLIFAGIATSVNPSKTRTPMLTFTERRKKRLSCRNRDSLSMQFEDKRSELLVKMNGGNFSIGDPEISYSRIIANDLER